MTIGSATSDVHMINIALTAADGSGANWQDPTQMIPLGMNGNPEAFVAAIKAGLPLVNNLRVMFNEFSFNADGSMNPQFERFLTAAKAQGFELTICYGGGDAQRIGIGDATHPFLTNAQAYSQLRDNYADIAGAWTKMLDWMDDHSAVKSAVYGWELMNESAGYRNTIRENGADATYTTETFVGLYARHVAALTDIIQARAVGNILVGGWGYNGDFESLVSNKVGSVTAIDYLRAAVGEDLVWSAHLYSGWMGTTKAATPAQLTAMLDKIYAPVAGDNVLVTEINVHGTVDSTSAASIDTADLFAASLDWFGRNGIGLGWYPGVQEGAAHLLYVEGDASLTYRHQHSLAHALDGFSLGISPNSSAQGHRISVTLTTANLRNETYEVAAGEALFDTVTKMGSAFGFGGNDTLLGTDGSNDFLYGGTGHDRLVGAGADDFLFGQSGDDVLIGGIGIDHLFGGAGNDQLDSGWGGGLLEGGSGDDTYTVRSTKDVVNEYANQGVDQVNTELLTLSLAAGRSTQYANVENLAYTGTGNFTGTGNARANVIAGNAGKDRLFGMNGNDTLSGGAGADRLDGGANFDTASYRNAAARVVVYLSGKIAGQGEAAGDVFTSIENVHGSAFNDKIAGNSAANTLCGLAGADTLAGGAGSDRLYGGSGADHFLFQTGYDTDAVMDFADNVDSLHIDIGAAMTVSKGMTFAAQAGADVVFDFGAGDVLRVLNTTKAALVDDIFFV